MIIAGILLQLLQGGGRKANALAAITGHKKSRFQSNEAATYLQKHILENHHLEMERQNAECNQKNCKQRDAKMVFDGKNAENTVREFRDTIHEQKELNNRYSMSPTPVIEIVVGITAFIVTIITCSCCSNCCKTTNTQRNEVPPQEITSQPPGLAVIDIPSSFHNPPSYDEVMENEKQQNDLPPPYPGSETSFDTSNP